MGLNIEKLTDRDIRKFKREMEGYKRSKRIFLVLGFVFMGLTIFLLALAIMFGVFGWLCRSIDNGYWEYARMYLFFSLAWAVGCFASTFFLVTIAMFILRAVLFEKKIENRIVAIEEYEELQKKRGNQQQVQTEEASEVVDK